MKVTWIVLADVTERYEPGLTSIRSEKPGEAARRLFGKKVWVEPMDCSEIYGLFRVCAYRRTEDGGLCTSIIGGLGCLMGDCDEDFGEETERKVAKRLAKELRRLG